MRAEGKVPLGERLRGAIMKPAAPGTVPVPEAAPVDESEARWANDKERLIGLIAAPFGALIGMLVTSALIAHDPAAYLADGQPDKLHVSVALYHEVLVALLAMSIVMLVAAWLRKRLYLGMVLALYGLTLFNLHYWGFALPYLLCGAWLLVRAYRLQKSLREATGSAGAGAGLAFSGPPRASRRYTPPAPASRSGRAARRSG